MTDVRTQALAAQYSRLYGSEADNDHMRPDPFDSADGQTHSYGDGCNPPHAPPPDHTTVATCPVCGIQATVLEDRVPALLKRWRQEHEHLMRAVWDERIEQQTLEPDPKG